MSQPTSHYWEIAKHVMRYLKQTQDYAIYYTGEGPNEVQIDCDADYANDSLTCRSITGVCAQICGNLVEWTSSKQDKVAKSTGEAELRQPDLHPGFFSELIDVSKWAFRVYCDNQPTKALYRRCAQAEISAAANATAS